MEGAPAGHTPGEVSSVGGSSAAADVVGGGGGDGDTLGGCAVGESRGRGNASGPGRPSRRAPGALVGAGKDDARAEAAITEDTGGGVTTEDTGEDI